MVAWIYGAERFIGDIQCMLQWRPGTLHSRLFRAYWQVMWRFVAPLVCLAILLATLATYKPMTYDKEPFPGWANAVGWCVSLVSVTCIPVAALTKILMTPGTLRQRLDCLLRPTEEWGPRKAEHRRMAERKWAEGGYSRDGRKPSNAGKIKKDNNPCCCCCCCCFRTC